MATAPVYQPDALAASDIETYLETHRQKSLLRFITCGSVDDGKSTLIGRLLHDTKLLFDDQLAALEKDSLRHGTQNGEIDFALLGARRRFHRRLRKLDLDFHVLAEMLRERLRQLVDER